MKMRWEVPPSAAILEPRWGARGHRLRLCMLLVLGLSASSSLACPACKDQVPSQKTADGKMLIDPQATQRGFALSIYILLSAVYGLPCLLGFMLWRSVRAAQVRKRRLRAARVPAESPARDPASRCAPASTAAPGAPGSFDERETGLPAIMWGPAREEAGS